MRNKKTSPTSGVTQVEGKADYSSLSLDGTDFITDGEIRQGYVESFLLPGVENAIPTKSLLALTGYKNARTLQAEIEHERENGSVILSKSSGHGGYFLAENEQEIKQFERTLRSRALHTLKTLAAVQKVYRQVPGQMSIETLLSDKMEAR